MLKVAEYLPSSVGELGVILYRTYAVIRVPSSVGGKYYAVTVTRSTLTCECKGYSVWHRCRHITIVRSAIGAE
jgi:hypothetical protein